MRRVVSAFKNRILIAMLLIFAMLVSVSGYATAFETAVALEQQHRCGMSEHIHSEACYSGDILICGQKTHVHGENCYILSLEDNDINGLLSLVDSEADKSLESMLNRAISEGVISSDIVLNESLNTSLTSDSGGAGIFALLALAGETTPSSPGEEAPQQDPPSAPAPEAEPPQQDPPSAPAPEAEAPQQDPPSAFTPEADNTAMPVEGDNPNPAPADIEIVPYLQTNGGNYFITLLDINNHELPKDTNGHYIAMADTTYKLTISFTTPGGFENARQEIYHYQLPDGFEIDPNTVAGTFVLQDTTNVGSWAVDDNRIVTLRFNEEINSRTDITVSLTMQISFPEESELVDFDGKITAAVQSKPQQAVTHTELNKWGVQGKPENAQDPSNSHKTDPSKIYWTVKVEGNKNSAIPGSTLSDRILLYDWSNEHHYTEEDMAAGLKFGVSAIDPETNSELFWHQWSVLPGDQNLIWGENGWSYTMPETVTCKICHEEILLGNEYWTYFVEYTSTPSKTDVAGVLDYSNMAQIDQQTKEGWAGFIQDEVKSAVFKTGTFVSDAEGGRFLWELKATIQGRQPDKHAKIDWHILDTTAIVNEWGGVIERLRNNMQLVSVTANYYGQTINVPLLKDATENDPYALIYNEWSSVAGQDPIDTQQYKIMCRCQCTADNCDRYPNCWTYGYVDNNGLWHGSSDFCECWLETEDTTFTFTYEASGADVIAAYNGSGNYLRNVAILANPAGESVSAAATIPIPSVLEKTIPPQDDSDIIHYNITLNRSRLILNDGSPLKIHDVMTDTMTYISGSLVVKAVDAGGNETVLKQGIDYTVTYDGTGTQTDNQNHPAHVLDIVILHPRPIMYLLDYDTTFIIPDQISGGIKYSNYASVRLWGKTITSAVAERVHANINSADNIYKLEIHKTSADDGHDLQGASFGLYNESGGLITSAVTNAYGRLTFQTYVPQGIIIHDHTLYYVQEIKAPSGYRLDDTKHWFYFCDETDGPCELCKENWAGPDVKRFPYNAIANTVAKIELENEPGYELPLTGGTGTAFFRMGGSALAAAALLLLYLEMRRKEGDADA